jgi:hypothetical protein
MTFDQRYFWKIDYYDLAGECGSSDPANPAVTRRVLTVMRTMSIDCRPCNVRKPTMEHLPAPDFD